MDNNFSSPSAFPPPGTNSGGFGPPQAHANATPPVKAKGKQPRRKGAKGSKGTNPDGSERVVTRRVITRSRTIFILIALAAAGLIAVVLTQEPPKTYVVRSSASIGQFATIQPDQLEAVAVDPESVEAGAFTGDDPKVILEDALDAIGDGRLQYPLTKNQQIHPEQFATEATLPEALQPNERLISISAVASTSVSGNIRAGDHVDIIAVSRSTGPVTSSIIKTNVPVESVSLSGDQLDSIAASQADPESTNYDKGVGEIVPGTLIPGTYVVRVTTDDVLKFAAADGDEGTQLYLVYRGADAVDVEGQAPLFIEEALGFTPAAQ